jgi:hypothetical protein
MPVLVDTYIIAINYILTESVSSDSPWYHRTSPSRGHLASFCGICFNWQIRRNSVILGGRATRRTDQLQFELKIAWKGLRTVAKRQSKPKLVISITDITFLVIELDPDLSF